MKRRSFFQILAASVLVLLLISVGGVYWILAHSPLAVLRGSAIAYPTTTVFIPRQAPIVGSLLVNPTQLEALRQLEVKPSQRGRSRSELNQIKSSLLANTGLDYQRDIAPWLGDEITLAVTTFDRDRDPSNGRQPGYLLVATTNKPQAARELLDLYWQRQAIAGTDLVFEPYKGVKLIYTSGDGELLLETKQPTLNNAFATAVVGSDYVLFANDPQVLKAAINNVQVPELNLSNSGDYQTVLEQLSDRAIALIHFNLPQIRAFWQPISAPQPPTRKRGKSTPPEDAPKTEPLSDPVFQSLAVALEANRQGAIAQTLLLAAPGQTLTPTDPTLSRPLPILNYLPKDVSLGIAGDNLQQFWQQVQSSVTGYPVLAQLFEQPLKDLEARASVNLESDIFSAVQNHYALGLLPRRDRESPDWIFVAQRTPETENNLINRLDERAKERGYSIGSFDLGEQKITVWTKLTSVSQANESNILKAQVQGVRTRVEDYEILTTSIEAMDRVLQAEREGSLGENREFLEAISPLRSPNDGYVYLDWVASQSILEKQIPVLKLLELAGKPLFDHLRSLSMSSYGTTPTTRTADIFLKLGE